MSNEFLGAVIAVCVFCALMVWLFKKTEPEQPDRMRQFWDDQAEWSQMQFGSDKVIGPRGPLRHLAKEVKETIEAPFDPIEYADMLHLLFDAARRSGMSYDQLTETAHEKLDINRNRRWQARGEDGTVEHVRE